MKKKKWWQKGVRFECQGSGKCCTTHGGFGHVYVPKQERQAMARVLKLTTLQFTKRFCEKSGGLFHLKDGEKGKCFFLSGKNRCRIYKARPTQCSTWPFWPELMGESAWQKEVKPFCPGVGKGAPVAEKEIRAQLDRQKRADAMED